VRYNWLAGVVLLCSLLVALGSVQPAAAVPDLQLYIPDAAWDPATETWVTTAPEFDLWVIGANYAIEGVKVAAALDPDADPASGVVTMTSYQYTGAFPPGSNPQMVATATYGSGGSSFCSGTPVMGNGKPLPDHDIYPTWYGLVDVGNFTPQYNVPNMYPTETGEALGEIRTVHVQVSGFRSVHFDAYNHYLWANKVRARFAPFSHDAEMVVPEPGTLLLAAPCLIGLLAPRLRRKR